MAYDPEMKEIIDAFVAEGYERLEEAESQLSLLQEANHEEIVQTIFRLFHSLKGSAGYLNFENIQQLTHEAESLLDIFRKTGVNPSSEDVDLIYRTMDFLRQLLDHVAQQLTDEGFESQIDLMVRDISDTSVRCLRERVCQEAQNEAVSLTEQRGEPVSRQIDSGGEPIHHVAPPFDGTNEYIPVIEEEIPVYEEVPVEIEGSTEETLLETDVLKGDVDRQKELPQEGEGSLVICQEEEYVVSAEGAEFVEVRCEEEPSNIHMIQEEVIALSEGAESAIALSREEEAEKEVREEKKEEGSPEEPQSPLTIPQFTLENLVTPKMVERFRSETGELLDEAKHGKDALPKLEKDHFDCFIVDYNMPEMNGIAFIKAVRAIPEYKMTPIIMLTTEREQDKQEEGRQAGANRWIVKPFKNEVLQATIRELLT